MWHVQDPIISECAIGGGALTSSREGGPSATSFVALHHLPRLHYAAVRYNSSGTKVWGMAKSESMPHVSGIDP